MNNSIKYISRELRKNQTISEKVFWNLVRNKKMLGYRFLRQYVIKVGYENSDRYFIVDFYCSKKKLVVEIDGKIHENQKEYDNIRTKIINELGINVIRIKNDELNDVESIKRKLMKYLEN